MGQISEAFFWKKEASQLGLADPSGGGDGVRKWGELVDTDQVRKTPGWFKMRPAGWSRGLGRQSHKLLRAWVWGEQSLAELGKAAVSF